MKDARTILITGAAGNLGTVVTKKFLSLNYRVIACVHGQNSFDHSENLLVEELNVFDETACSQFIQRTIEIHGSIDCAALLVGGFAAGKIDGMNEAQLLKMIQLNFLSAQHLFIPLMNHMIENKMGRIVLAGAQSVFAPSSGTKMSSYVLSKSLLFKASELINEAGKNSNVTCSVLSPSTIDTPENRASMPDADFSLWNKPSDLAQLIVDFCEDRNHQMVLSL